MNNEWVGQLVVVEFRGPTHGVVLAVLDAPIPVYAIELTLAPGVTRLVFRTGDMFRRAD